MSKLSLPQDLRGLHIHFVGIKGTGMAALVEIIFHRGAKITGSDVSERFYTDEILEKLNLHALPFAKENITDDINYVIYSSAYHPETNPDLAEAVRRNIPMMLYTEALGSISDVAYSSAVCGVHGKTTTTGLVGTILEQLPLPSQVLAGSIITSFGGTCTMTHPLSKNLAPNQKPYFVAETCEYQKHFMSFSPQKIILTSVEHDHPDFYPTYNDIRDSFVDFVCKLPQNGQLIYCADDKGAQEVADIVKAKRNDIQMLAYGEKASGDYKLTFGKIENGCRNFSISSLGDFKLYVPGDHFVRNACAAAALCTELLRTAKVEITPQIIALIAKGIAEFKGGKRRSEIVGQVKNSFGDSIIFVDDYGHHPTAIQTTLDGFRDFYKGRKIIVDFMSHTYSRTQSLLNEFASSFGSADEVVLHKIYASARENISDFTVSGILLYNKTKENYKNVYYFEEILDAEPQLLQELESPAGKNYPNGYLFVTMGAGDNWKIGKKLLADLQEKQGK